MDLIELHFRYRIAVTDMARASTRDARAWAAECADYYANRILSLHQRPESDFPAAELRMPKAAIHG